MTEEELRHKLLTAETRLSAITAERAALDAEWDLMQEQRRSALTDLNHLQHSGGRKQ